MIITSWNLNGLLSTLSNGSFCPLVELAPDFLCLQEIRTQQEPLIVPGYHHLWNHCQRDGYSGTAILTKQQPVRVVFGCGKEDPEGRAITVELPQLYIVNAYAPNSQKSLERHAYRLQWDESFREYVCGLKEYKPVIICGDFNVARTDLDIYPENMRQYFAQQGFASDERSNLEELLEEGFTDVFRYFNPDERGYTWWSNRKNKRDDGRGWRLDYFFVSDDLLPAVIRIQHLTGILGSDHCPIMLEIAT